MASNAFERLFGLTDVRSEVAFASFICQEVDIPGIERPNTISADLVLAYLQNPNFVKPVTICQEYKLSLRISITYISGVICSPVWPSKVG
jgi:hypothetical protein